MIVIPAPVRPDLDCIGGAFAYAALLRSRGEEVAVWLSGTPDGEAQYYLDLYPQLSFVGDDVARAATAYVLVDISEPEPFPDWFDRAHVRQIIDHRFPPKVAENFPNADIQLEKVGAAATLVAEHVHKAGLVLPAELATMLYGAIYSNTLCLKGPLATERDKAMAAWLLRDYPGAADHVAGQLRARGAEILTDIDASLIAEMKFSTDDCRFGAYGFSQFEISGGAAFWQQEKARIVEVFARLPHPVVFNLIDLDTVESVIYASDARYQQILAAHFDGAGDTYYARPAKMRKEIAPLFRHETFAASA